MRGPFKVFKLISSSAVWLEHSKRWKIHDMFHVSFLEPYQQARVSGHPLPDLDQVLEDTDDVIPANKFLPQ